MPTFGAAGADLEGSSSSVNVAVPSGVVAGSYVTVIIFVDGAAQVTGVPTGFTLAPGAPVNVNQGGPGAHRLYVYGKRATGNDTGTYNFTLSANVFRKAVAVRWDGVISTGVPWDPGSEPFNVSTAQSGNTNVSTSPAVSITTSVADTLLIWVASNWLGGAWTPPTGFTERWDTGERAATLADMGKASAGATGTVQGSCAASDKQGAWLGALMGEGEGVQPSEGSAALDVTVEVAATGRAAAQGSAGVTLDVSLTVSGRAAAQGSADVTLSVDVSATGSDLEQEGGSAAVTLDVSISATGRTLAVGTADVGVALDVSATGDAPIPGASEGSASLTAEVSISASGVAVSRVIPVRALTREQILSGNRNTRFYLDLLDTNDSPIGRIEGVVGGKLDWVYNAVVKGAGQLVVENVGQDINWLTARIRPWMLIEGLDPQPLGVFLPSEAPQFFGIGNRWEIKLLDKTTILDGDTVAQTYSLPVGAVITDEIVTLIESAGITNHAITPSAATLTVPKVWPPATPKIRIINDLLAAINYFSLYANFDGQMVGAPYVLPARRPIIYEFLDGSTSIYKPEFKKDIDILGIPNRLTITTMGTGTTEGLTSTQENTNPNSPYSIANRGRVIGKAESAEATDQATLDAYTLRRLVELTSQTAEIEVYHAPVPGLTVNQTVRFRRVPAGIDARHTVIKTSLELSGAALAQTTFREVVDL